jgi:hypothetical protein
MKLLSEIVDQDIDYLVENTAQGKKYFIEGNWASANAKNRNGRVYPMNVMENALGKYNNEYVSQKRALGELNHPPTPQLNLDRVSHIIENLKMQGEYVVGRAKVMDTPMGKIVQNLIDEGVKLGVSTRGLGSLVERNGSKEVQNDFFITAIDVVSDPSGKDCWVNPVMESMEYVLTSDGHIIEKATEIIVESVKNKIDESVLASEFGKLMTMIAEGGTTPIVDHSSYARSHMKSPKGEGSWMFSSARSINFDNHEEGKHYVTVNGKFGEAKKKAQEWAKTQGHKVIYTQP